MIELQKLDHLAQFNGLNGTHVSAGDMRVFREAAGEIRALRAELLESRVDQLKTHGHLVAIAREFGVYETWYNCKTSALQARINEPESTREAAS